MRVAVSVWRNCGFLGDDIEFIVDCYYSFTPGKYSGPPEHCYPDDEEFDVEGVSVVINNIEVDVTKQFFDVMFNDQEVQVKAAEKFAEEASWER